MSSRGAGRTSGLRAVLAGSGYRRLWAARTVSQWGDTVNVVALALLSYELTGSALGVSGVVAAEIAPALLLAPVAGPLVDRWPRVRVMVCSDLVRLVLAGLLVGWHDSPVVVYLVASGMSVGAVFFNPAASSLLPALVHRDDLVAANTGIWTTAVVSQIALSPLAGILVAVAGYGPAFALNAASFAVSALVLAGLRVPGRSHPDASQRLLVEAREGVRALAADRLLRALAAGQLLAALSAGATSALLVVLAEDRLNVSGGGYGLLIASIGIGAAVGPLLLLRFVRHPRRPLFVFGPFALRGVVDLALASATALPAAAAALVAYGVGTSSGAVTFSSMLQAETPAHVRGRVFASMDVLWQAGRLVSLAAGGLLADAAGIRAVYYVGGLLLLAAAAAGLSVRDPRPGRG